GLPHGDTISAYIIQVSAAFGKRRGAEKTLSNAKICTKKTRKRCGDDPHRFRVKRKEEYG
uniref:hypothetical protein n=1 Tax=Gemmiger sp. TaxID=2049027 RepID=UPI003FEE610D